MSGALALAVAALLTVVVFFASSVWERTGREHWIVFLLLGMVAFESALYENQDTMPHGLFHPGSGSLEFRLPEVVITAALVARLVVRGRPTRVGWPAILVLIWAGWFLVEAAEGVLRHNSLVKLPYEAKVMIYVGGAYALGAGVPAKRYLAGAVPALVRFAGVLASILLLVRLGLGSHWTGYVLHVPLLSTKDAGVLGNDAASVFVAIGIVGLVYELAKAHKSPVTLAAVVPLLLSPFFTSQRAVLLELAAALAVVAVGIAGPTARRRLQLRSGQVLIVGAFAVALALVTILGPALAARRPVQLPFSNRLSQTFNAQGKVESAQDRLNKWTVALASASEHPVLGQGLGYEFSYFEAGSKTYVSTDITENTELDLWLWAGVVGVVLFFLFILPALVDGWRTWRWHPDPAAAALALGLVAVIVGLLAKAQVESVLEKYRIVTLLGLSLGMLRSLTTSWSPAERGRGGPTPVAVVRSNRDAPGDMEPVG